MQDFWVTKRCVIMYNKRDKIIGGLAMSESCIFCRIIKGELPSEKIYENDYFIAIKDISPAAPKHALLIPKKHFKDITEADVDTINEVTNKISEIAEKMGVKDSGFRIVVNTGEDGGQTVAHLHFHILGGREMGWPPG